MNSMPRGSFLRVVREQFRMSLDTHDGTAPRKQYRSACKVGFSVNFPSWRNAVGNLPIIPFHGKFGRSGTGRVAIKSCHEL